MKAQNLSTETMAYKQRASNRNIMVSPKSISLKVVNHTYHGDITINFSFLFDKNITINYSWYTLTGTQQPHFQGKNKVQC